MVATSRQLEEKARQCQELADTAMTDEARAVLSEIARKYELEASQASVAHRRSHLIDAAA